MNSTETGQNELPIETSASNTINVCMVAVYFYPDIGGIQMTLLALSQQLQKMGVSVTVITRRTHDNPYFEVVNGLRIFRLDIPKSKPKIIAAFQFIAGSLIILWKEKTRYQVVHSHQLVTPTTIGLLAKTFLGKKLVLTPHTPSTAGAFRSLVYKRPLTGKPRIKWMQKSADAVVAISEEIKRDLFRLGFPPKMVSYIPNGVDTERFSPIDEAMKRERRRELGISDGPVIICAGRLIPRKQIDVLIKAFSMLVPELPSTSILMVLGDGEERSRLEELAMSLDVSSQIHFMGSVLDAHTYLQASDVFVIPSSIEGMPIILLEAMSCGLPSIGSKIGGIEDLIADGKTGIFVNSGDVADLKEKINSLIKDRQFALRLGQAARNEIVKNYSMETTARNHLDLYKCLLDTRSGKRNGNKKWK